MKPDQLCWVEVINNTSELILVKKYRRLQSLHTQHILHTGEKKSIAHGETWKTPFKVKIYSTTPDLKKKNLRQKFTVDKMYRITIDDTGHSYKIIQHTEIDKQLIAQKRMDEVWENTDYYETLRIPRSATQKEIRVAYLKLAREYHPDKNPNPCAALMFDRVAEAYHTLSDEEVRRQYDIMLDRNRGMMTKSYWRQVLCVWNRHKAAQVGISAFLAATGCAIMLGSLIAAATGFGLAGTIAGSVVGGVLFGAGIGGVSNAFSQEAQLKDNKQYKQWLKYCTWYGLAGGAMGVISGCLAGAVIPLGGMGAFVAAATIQGAATGVCFSGADGMASDRWIANLKKLRIDMITLDLLMGALQGAATGALFESLFRGTGALAHNAAYSIACMAKTGGQTIHKNVKQQQALIEYRQQALLENPEPLLLEDVVAEQCDSDSVELISEAIELYDTVSKAKVEKILTFINNSKSCTCKMIVNYLKPCMMEGSEEPHLEIMKEELDQNVRFLIPEEARCIQVHFEYKLLATKVWKPIMAWNKAKKTGLSPESTQVYSYDQPLTRRYTIDGMFDAVCVVQVRDEFEQPCKD